MRFLPGSLRLIAATVLTMLAVLGIGLLLLAWSGLYNIAASRGHWAIVEWFLAFGMRNSVELRTGGIPAPPLGSPDLQILGAGHFHGGCAFCHGAPGTPVPPIAQQMLPAPPELSVAVRQWNEQELFWIVKHGIKYTGMPAWASQQRDDEVWAVVAFLKQLPKLNAQEYRDLALGSVQVEPQSGRELATEEGASEAVSACARCHGAQGSRPASNLVPVLHGQPREFLLGALLAYANGARESGIMQPVAAELTPEAARRLAQFYSRLSAPPGRPAANGSVENGRSLATNGLSHARIPPCAVCHDADALASYPRLAGQNAPYMAGRLRRWKQGFRSGTATDAIMAPIAQLLSEQQIAEVSAYFATLPATSSGGAQRP
jgi:cytochrome c553